MIKMNYLLINRMAHRLFFFVNHRVLCIRLLKTLLQEIIKSSWISSSVLFAGTDLR